jgi:hypothetical protein
MNDSSEKISFSENSHKVNSIIRNSQHVRHDYHVLLIPKQPEFWADIKTSWLFEYINKLKSTFYCHYITFHMSSQNTVTYVCVSLHYCHMLENLHTLLADGENRFTGAIGRVAHQHHINSSDWSQNFKCNSYRYINK